MTRGASPVVVRFGRLGDMVLLQPLLRHLHRRFGQPCTLLARGAWSTSLYAGHEDVAGVLNVHDSHRPLVLSPRQWRVIAGLRRLRNAPVYVCEPEPRALAKARRMLKFAGVARENCIYLCDTPPFADEHWVERLLRFGDRTPDAWRDAAYAANVGKWVAPTLHVSDADRADCDAWLRGNGWDSAPLVLLQPANRRTMRWNGMRGVEDDKWWPIERWVSLARSIREVISDSRILLCGAPREAGLLRMIRDATADARVHVVADALPLRRLMALQEVAHSMISVDTGPAHMAAALGCPLVVMFGKVSATQWLPRSDRGSDVIAIGGPLRGGRIDALSVNEVLATWAMLAPRRMSRVP
jgi:heptosyltransferase-2/heptosyltransferase-3